MYIILVVLPLVIGVLFGGFVRWRAWPYWPLFIMAPLVAALIEIALFGLMNLVELATTHSTSRNSYPIYVQAFAGALLLTPSLLLFGIIPSMLGYLVLSRRED